MQVGIYPTRNFATLGEFVTIPMVRDGPLISDGLFMSPRSSDCIMSGCLRITTGHSDKTAFLSNLQPPSNVQSLRISRRAAEFPADGPHPRNCHHACGAVSRDTRMFQHTVGFYNGPVESLYAVTMNCDTQSGQVATTKSNRYSYGRRLPGLRFRASLTKVN